MPAIIQINSVVFDRLKKSYSDTFGESPSKLIEALNRQYDVKPGRGGIDSLISDKTIRNFFKESEPPVAHLKNLNYLCQVLLGYKSYEDALKHLSGETPDVSGMPTLQFSSQELDLQAEWLLPYREKLEVKCSKVKILDMTQPIDLKSIYTEVNVLEESRKQKQRSVAEVLTVDPFSNQSFSRLIFQPTEKQIFGVEAVNRYHRLFIFGKPGAGKTTFTRYLALRHLSESFDSEEVIEAYLPIYIQLKEFSEDEDKPSLVETIIKEITSAIPNSKIIIETWLKAGKCLILLDALDEVLSIEVDRVYRNIDDLIRRYPKNKFVITCRTEASNYTFKDFTITEIADFNDQQISKFVASWFENASTPELGEIFLEKIKEKPAITELATSPLLLTNLCLVFQDSYELPANLNGLLGNAVEILLRKWDSSRRIERRITSQGKLSSSRKLDMFSEIAYFAFNEEPKSYAWYRWSLDRLIREFIQDVEGISPKTLDLDVEALLEDIESNNGIMIRQGTDVYTFSHLTFQEFFTARYIANSFDPSLIQTTVEEHLSDRQWREVFIILAGRLTKADNLLRFMFCYANSLIKNSQDIQQMLRWLNDVTSASQVQSSSWRSGYLAVDLDITLYIENAITIDRSLAQKLSISLRNFNKKMEKIVPRSSRSYIELNLAAIHSLAIDYASSLNMHFNEFSEYTGKFVGLHGAFSIKEKLQQIIQTVEKNPYNDLEEDLLSLEAQTPSNSSNKSEWKEWSDELQAIMIRNLDVGHEISLSEQDIKLLENYLYSCNLLLDCIQADSRSSIKLREAVIDSILLPHEFLPENLQKP